MHRMLGLGGIIRTIDHFSLKFSYRLHVNTFYKTWCLWVLHGPTTSDKHCLKTHNGKKILLTTRFAPVPVWVVYCHLLLNNHANKGSKTCVYSSHQSCVTKSLSRDTQMPLLQDTSSSMPQPPQRAAPSSLPHPETHFGRFFLKRKLNDALVWQPNELKLVYVSYEE